LDQLLVHDFPGIVGRKSAAYSPIFAKKVRKVEGRSSFLKKEPKNFFAPLRAVLEQPGPGTNKVFLLLFVHKKKSFLSLFLA
jgi:hypothetical protein